MYKFGGPPFLTTDQPFFPTELVDCIHLFTEQLSPFMDPLGFLTALLWFTEAGLQFVRGCPMVDRKLPVIVNKVIRCMARDAAGARIAIIETRDPQL